LTRNPLRDLLSRILHDPTLRKADYEVIYLSRGSTEGREYINCSLLIRVTRDFFIYKDDKGVVRSIPLHRVISVIDKRKDVVLYLNPK